MKRRSGAERGKIEAASRSPLAANRHLGDDDLRLLLGREPVRLGPDALRPEFAGRRVLVTGAGGTVGSEIVRQISGYGPAAVVLVDRSESDLFRIDLELRRIAPEVESVPVLLDILDVARLSEVFRAYAPQCVLHAAAYKHVPLMERHPFTAIRNNAFGTRSVAALARRHGTSSFLLISTDKAVNPTSVMGVSKRIAELLVLGYAASSDATKYRIVRFGNVLSSNGSVVPVFLEQLSEGRPVTITDVEATRYFMSISEAVRLVLGAAAMRSDGEIFVLDMGEPVRIIDLARALMRMHGVDPDASEPIITGLRPGEKLHEELRFASERFERTALPRVLRVRAQLPDEVWLRTQLRALRRVCGRRDVTALLAVLREIVPEYEPSEVVAALEISR